MQPQTQLVGAERAALLDLVLLVSLLGNTQTNKEPREVGKPRRCDLPGQWVLKDPISSGGVQSPWRAPL